MKGKSKLHVLRILFIFYRLMIIEIMWIFEDWFDKMTDLDNKNSLDLHRKVYIFEEYKVF